MNKLFCLLLILYFGCEPNIKNSPANNTIVYQEDKIKYIQFGLTGGNVMPTLPIISYQLKEKILNQIQFFDSQKIDTILLDSEKFNFSKKLIDKLEPEIISFFRNRKGIELPNNDSQWLYLKVHFEKATPVSINSRYFPDKFESYKKACWAVIAFLNEDSSK